MSDSVGSKNGLLEGTVPGTLNTPFVTHAEIISSEVDKIAQSYCETYAGEPWFQQFNRDDVITSINELLKLPGSQIVCTYDSNGDVVSFFICYESSRENVLDEFQSTYLNVINTAVKDQPIPDNTEEHSKVVTEKLRTVLEQKNAETVIHVIDLGIIPRKQGDPRTIIDTYKMVISVLGQSKASVAIGDTLSIGPMLLIFKKKFPSLDIIDTYPDDQPYQHLTLTFDMSDVPIINSIIQ